MRHDGRLPNELRPVELVRGFTDAAPGSVLIRTGRTHVLCTASILEDSVPPWRELSGQGWVTAEYEMLPASTRNRRDRTRNKVDGRTHEIQRLIARSLRAAVNMERLGAHTIYLDCDVLQADGGTRTAAITGAYVALCDALDAGEERGLWGNDVRVAAVAAVSVGVVGGQILLDLDYVEDSGAEVDANVVMTDFGEWIEVQATGEQTTFSPDQMTQMLELARVGCQGLFQIQSAALAGAIPRG
ncbi:MAG: ribonuclease PH [Phycisphaerales bacterium]|nr:ribonuclease PH [Phycisphaerales bacterium]